MTRRKKIVIGIIVVVAVIIAVPVALRVAILVEERSVSRYADAYPPPPTSFRRSGGPSGISAGLEYGVATGLSARPSLFASLKRPSPTAPPSPTDTAAGEVRTDRLVIRSGYLSFVARDVPKVVAQVTALVEEAKGFVVESAIDDVTTSPRARMRVRIPAEGLDAFLGKVRAFGTRIVSESTTGEDVTEEYVDLQAQLRNLKASEEQFLEILKRAQTIEDILNVQRQLERVRGEIDRSEGRKKYLEQSAAMSTVQLYIAAEEDALPTLTPQQRWRPKAIWKSAVRSLILTAQGLANLAIRLAVLAPIWVPIVLIVWFFWRRHRRRAAMKKAAPPGP